MTRRLTGALAATLMLSTGCIVVVDYDPVGTDVDVNVQWTINGTTATADQCAAAGISTVEVRVSDTFGFGEYYSTATMRASCADGGLTTGRILAGGQRYYVRFVALNASGGVVQSSDITDFGLLNVGDTLSGTADFQYTPAFDPQGTDVTIAGSWMINDKIPTVADCTGVGIDTIALRIYSADRTEAVDFEYPCEQGSVDTRVSGSPVLAIGSYHYQWLAKDAAGMVITNAMTEIEGLDAGVAGHADLNMPNFIIETGFDPTLGGDTTTTGEWTINGMVPTAGLCTSAGVTSVTLRIFDETETEAVDYDYDCAAGGFDPGPTIASAMFYFQFLAKDAAGVMIEGSATDVTILNTTAASNVDFATVDFVFAMPMRVNLFFETAMSSDDFVPCADIAALSAYNFQLYDSTVSPVAGASGTFDCDAGGNDILEFEGLAAGDYDLDVNATGSDGTKWGTGDFSGCGGFTEPSLGATYDCFVDVVP